MSRTAPCETGVERSGTAPTGCERDEGGQGGPCPRPLPSHNPRSLQSTVGTGSNAPLASGAAAAVSLGSGALPPSTESMTQHDGVINVQVTMDSSVTRSASVTTTVGNLQQQQGPIGPDTGVTASQVRGAAGRDAFEGKGPQRGSQRQLHWRLEEIAEAVGGGYCRLQMPLSLALAVRETVAGHRLGALGRGGGGALTQTECHTGGRMERMAERAHGRQRQ